jgi:acetyl esterase/lipase
MNFIDRKFPHIVLGMLVMIVNGLALYFSVRLLLFHPTWMQQNIWGAILFGSFIFNYIAVIIVREFWIYATPENRMQFAVIKGWAVLYLLYTFLGYLAVQALLQWPIIGVGGVNLLFIFGFCFGLSILLFPINRMPSKLYAWFSKHKSFGRKTLILLVGVFVGLYSFIIFLRLFESQSLIMYIFSFLISMNVVTVFLWTLTIDTLSVWLVPRNWPKQKKIVYAGVCILITVLTFAPTYRVANAPAAVNEQFAQEFGPNWNSFSPATSSHFLSNTWSVSGYFYGPDYYTQARNWVWVQNLSFYNGSDYQLYYDVFYPATPVPEIGNYSTILYIPGGAYIGGKRSSAQIQCKYFASQGYVVFCCDYRVIDMNKLALSDELGFNIPAVPTNPSYKTGDYTFKDMIYDIGLFTHFLADNPNHYGANYNRTYFYGESSGGHLAAVVAYGWDNPWYEGNFSKALTPVGAMLYYPPILASEIFYYYHPIFTENHQFISGTPETNPEFFYATPSFLISNSSIPCILFHGTADEIVPFHHSLAMKKQMDLYNRTCILVSFGSIGHGFTHDYQFQYLNLYYMERFLMLVR